MAESAFSAALSGLEVAQQAMSVTANNIANQGTNGFKAALLQTASVISGSGVAVSAIVPDFSEGPFEASDSNLDLAIDGDGFFVTQTPGGTQVFTRAGSFQVSNQGTIINSSGNNLIGYVADAAGQITGSQNILQVNMPIIPPTATANVVAGVNLDPSKTPPTVPFVSGFTPENPPSIDSYTAEEQIEVYDTLGDSHMMTLYFVKDAVLNTWQVHVGIDGIDVTPNVPTPPSGAGPNQPVAYATGNQAQPFTLIFNSSGQFVVNNPAEPPLYYGNLPPVSEPDVTTQGTLPTLGPLDLTINGTPIELTSPTADSFSFSDNTASALNIAAAINQSAAADSVTATANQNFFDLGLAPVGAPFVLGTGNLVINGIDMAGTYANAAALVAKINAIPSVIPNVGAAINGGNFILSNSQSVAYGMNITVTTNGGGPAGGNFGNFAINAGVLQQVARGTITLTPGNQTILPNTLDLGIPTVNGTGTFGAGELVINGVDLAGAYATVGDLITAIDANVPNTTAALNGAGELVLTNSFGCDIVVTTLGTEGLINNVTFAKFNTTGGPISQSAKGTLSDEQPIVIGGNNPANAGFIPGVLYGTVQTSSDPAQITFNPNSGAINPQTIKINYSSSTQYKGNYEETNLTQDGNATGKLVSNGISVDNQGIVTASYDNNTTLNLGQIVLARFPNQYALTDVGDTSYMPNALSGLALISAPGSSSLGTIVANNLESSNVQLTQELVALIQEQTMFGANAQTLRAQDHITQTMLSIK
jgi:flagellar hook protein FlgE